MVDFTRLLAEVKERDTLLLAIADRFIEWRIANAAQLQGAHTEPREHYAAVLLSVHRESPRRLDWAKLLAMPEGQFLAEISGILRHVNEDGTLRRNHQVGF